MCMLRVDGGTKCEVSVCVLTNPFFFPSAIAALVTITFLLKTVIRDLVRCGTHRISGFFGNAPQVRNTNNALSFTKH